MASVDQAREAKEVLKERIGHPRWLRGIGIGGRPGDYCVKVNVDRITAEVRSALPEAVNGVPVIIDGVGEIVPR